jgi:hypothetical protein
MHSCAHQAWHLYLLFSIANPPIEDPPAHHRSERMLNRRMEEVAIDVAVAPAACQSCNRCSKCSGAKNGASHTSLVGRQGKSRSKLEATLCYVKISLLINESDEYWEGCRLREEPLRGGAVTKMVDRCQHAVREAGEVRRTPPAIGFNLSLTFHSGARAGERRDVAALLPY